MTNQNPLKIGIVIDAWKQSIFEAHMKAAGYKITFKDGLIDGMMYATIEAQNAERIIEVLSAAQRESQKAAS